jgi:hypothetical protein
MSFLLDVKLPEDIFQLTGWAIIGVSAFNVFVNFVLVIVGSCKQTIDSCKQRHYSRRARNALEK